MTPAETKQIQAAAQLAIKAMRSGWPVRMPNYNAEQAKVWQAEFDKARK